MLRTLQHPDGQRHVNLAGWKKQLSDPRDADFSIKLHRSLLATRPTSADLRPICSAVEDQLDLGSCTANMFAAMVEANENRRLSTAAPKAKVGAVVSPTKPPTVFVGPPTVGPDGSITFTTKVSAAAPAAPVSRESALFQVSRLFAYYATRKIEGSIKEDAGAEIRNVIKAGVLYGIADEATYPYNVTKFAQDPGAPIWTAAATRKVTSYHAIKNGDIESMKAVLSGDVPFLVGFGFAVYDGFLGPQVAKSGLLVLPAKNEALQGGHAVALVGYDEGKKMPDGSVGAFLVRNSWGASWGLGGYFWMAQNYVANASLCNDFWVVMSSPV